VEGFQLSDTRTGRPIQPREFGERELKEEAAQFLETNQQRGMTEEKRLAAIIPNDVRFPASAFSGAGSIFSFQGEPLRHRDPPQPNCTLRGL
jgi:hypothetical protein